MTFASPWLLLLLLLLPVAIWFRRRRHAQPAFVYSSIGLVRGMMGLGGFSPGRVLLWMRWMALALMIIALARPQWGEGETVSKASGIDIVVAMDLSGSMAAEDFELRGQPVNRLEIEKDVLEQFVARRSNDRIGLVAFAGRAYIAAPLTLDHGFLLQNLERLQLGAIEDGTAIGAGVSAGLNRLRDLKSKSKIIILMTDGVNNAGKIPPLTAAEAAQALGVKIYSIGVGTRGVARVPLVDVFGQKRYVQQKVDIDEDTLTQMSNKTGGKYYRADKTETLRKIYAEIDQLEKTEADIKKFQRYRELFQWFATAGFAILLLEIVLSHTVWRRLP